MVFWAEWFNERVLTSESLANRSADHAIILESPFLILISKNSEWLMIGLDRDLFLSIYLICIKYHPYFIILIFNKRSASRRDFITLKMGINLFKKLQIWCQCYFVRVTKSYFGLLCYWYRNYTVSSVGLVNCRHRTQANFGTKKQKWATKVQCNFNPLVP